MSSSPSGSSRWFSRQADDVHVHDSHGNKSRRSNHNNDDEEEGEMFTPLLRDDQAINTEDFIYGAPPIGSQDDTTYYTAASDQGRSEHAHQQREFRLSELSRSLEEQSLFKQDASGRKGHANEHNVELNSSINSYTSSLSPSLGDRDQDTPPQAKTSARPTTGAYETSKPFISPSSIQTPTSSASHHDESGGHTERDVSTDSGGRKDKRGLNLGGSSPRVQKSFKHKFKGNRTSPQVNRPSSSLPSNERDALLANGNIETQSHSGAGQEQPSWESASVSVSNASEGRKHKHVPQSPSRQPFIPKRNTLLASKVRYYSSLRHIQNKHAGPKVRQDSGFLIPPVHLIDPTVFGLEDTGDGKEQSSWATISTIVNTMMGTTVVALPFGFAHAGIAMSLLLIGMIGVVACFTCILIVHHGRDFDEFSDFVRHYLGARMQLLSWIMSIAVIVGAAMIYHILMQESFFEVVETILNYTYGYQKEHAGWSRPIAALIPLLVFPFANFKSIKKLVKFNGVGFVFLWYTLFFIFYHGVRTLVKQEAVYQGTMAGTSDGFENGTMHIVYGARVTFGSLSGMMMLSFFIHNCIQPIVKNAPFENRKRDIMFAYILAGTCYTLVGALGYLGFADGGEVKGNFLEMFPTTFNNNQDIYAFTARASLLGQLLVVYPVLVYIIRTQTLGYLYDDTHPGLPKVLTTSTCIFAITYTIAALNVNVAAVTRFSGAICGFVLIFVVPIGVDMLIRRRDGTWNWPWRILHIAMLTLGSTVFVLQFIPSLSP